MSKSVTDIVREDAQARFHRIASEIANETLELVSAKTGHKWEGSNMMALSKVRDVTRETVIHWFGERYVEAAVQAAAKRLIG